MKKFLASLLIFSQIASAAGSFVRPDSLVLPKKTQTQRDAIANPTAGLTIYNTTSSKANVYNGSTWVDVGSGSGGINYITGGDAESGTTGFSAYADAAGALPVDATGGSPTHISIATSGTAPLDGNNSFIITNSGSTSAQGEGISTPFTISTADEAKVLQVSFSYVVNSGTFVAGSDSATGDLNVYLYDVTNAQVIQPAGFKLTCSSTTIACNFSGTFQTASNSVSYRLAWHVAGTNTSAWSLKLDRISVSPVNQVYGASISDWQAYTPTYTGFGTALLSEMQWRRAGDTLQLRGKFTSGTSTATEARLSLPSGLTSADTTKIPSIQIAGSMGINTAGLANPFWALIEPSVSYVTFGIQDGTRGALAKQNGSAIANSGDTFIFQAQLPVQGWGSNTRISSDAGQRVVALSATTPTSAATGGYTTVVFGTVNSDTHSAYNPSTGVYTVQVPGWYRVAGKLMGNGTAGSQIDGYVLKNGTTQLDNFNAGNGSANGGSVASFDSLQKYNAGDTIQIQALNSATSPTWSGTYAYLNIERVSGPEQIAASETVSLQAGKTTAQSIANTTFTDITSWDAPSVDDHVSFNPTTGVYSVSSPGKYLVSATAAFASNSTGFRVTRIYQNGTVVRELSVAAIGNDGGASVTVLLNCIYGDQIKVGAFQNSGGALNTSTATGYTSLSIIRQGS